jgi:hypothetical protein
MGALSCKRHLCPEAGPGWFMKHKALEVSIKVARITLFVIVTYTTPCNKLKQFFNSYEFQ